MIFKSKYLLAAVVIMICGVVSPSHGATVLTADAMVDVVSGKLIQNPVLIIEDERIVAVNPKGRVPAADDKIIDLDGMTVLPGMIDTHVHITADATQHGYKGIATTATRAALRGVKFADITLQAGVTTIRNVGAKGFVDVDLREAINAGEIDGPRMFVSGPALGITGGHCDSNLLPYEYKQSSEGVADGPWEVAKRVRRNIKYGVDLIKFCATGGVLSKGTKVGVQQYSLEEMKMIVEEAHRRGLTVAAHAHGTSGINDAIRAGVDSVEHVSFLDDESIKLAKKMGTVFSMDIYNTEYILGEGEKAGILEESLAKERKTGKTQRESFSKAVEAGIPVVMGTDAGVYPHGNNLKQLSRMVQFGMTPMQALQGGTINAAKLLKQEANIGSLQEGRYADIIAVKGNPLEDLSILEDVSFVMKGGEVYKGETQTKAKLD